MGLKKFNAAAALHEVHERSYERDEAGLVRQLRDEDTQVRRLAARDLGLLDGSARSVAARALCEALAVEGHACVRSVLQTSLSQLADPASVPALLALLRSEDAAQRNGAIEVLAGMPDAVAPYMQAQLRDADPDVRILSVNLLAELAHPDVPHWLAQLLDAETEINVVGAAIEVLGEVGTAEALPALRAVRERFAADTFTCFAATLAMERIEAA
ncbi:HEAT repeat domain-containing protein [Azohydromonas aeria]|uniref:HEAT repeat domain-containing protein n=1 Tax=Azohydromonas aeria TaxID=2590212 RepID=UPI0012FCE26A|nr:HEAT repeat domain-containing protein [Azohydromonas aeria]